MRRREFITLSGSAAAAWPLAGRAQQAMPVIGFLDSRSPDALADRLRGFRQGLKDGGFVESENAIIVFRWAGHQLDRLPALADELVRRPVAVIAASGGVAVTLAAKAATTTIPIVFLTSADPVSLGFVESFARPGGNLTGINFFNRELAAKQLELLRELVPAATRVAVLVNPANTAATEATLRDVERVARYGIANSDRPRQHQPRDLCGLRNVGAGASRRPVRWRGPLPQQPASPSVLVGDV